ncbi:MAG: hypothetical protein AAGA77_14750 [Bacteroidota bacterium]
MKQSIEIIQKAEFLKWTGELRRMNGEWCEWNYRPTIKEHRVDGAKYEFGKENYEWAAYNFELQKFNGEVRMWNYRNGRNRLNLELKIKNYKLQNNN